MITTKQRAKLRAIANNYETIFQIGKGGIGANLTKQVDDALAARELVKLCVLENSDYTARDAAQELAPRVRADIVQVIGRRFVLWRRNLKKPVVELD